MHGRPRQPLGQRMLLAPARGVVAQPLERDPFEALGRLDQALDHDEPVPAPDGLRMHRQVIDAARDMRVRPLELAMPDLVHGRRGVLAHRDAGHELEVLEVAEAPRERDADEVDGLAELVRPVRGKAVATAQVVRLEVTARERGVVLEAVLEQDVHRVDADIDVRRAVAERPHACNLLEGIEPAEEDVALLFRRERGERLVHEAVMADLVARVADVAHEVGVDERGVTGDEERRRHVVTLQQRQDPRHGHGAELAARHRRHVAERHLVRPGRERVEIEREADREPWRGHAASAATDSSRASRTPSIWVASAMLGCSRWPATSSGRLGRCRKPAGGPPAAVACSAVYIAALQRNRPALSERYPGMPAACQAATMRRSGSVAKYATGAPGSIGTSTGCAPSL